MLIWFLGKSAGKGIESISEAWFNPGQQLSTMQLLAHASSFLVRRVGELEKRKVKFVD